MRTATDLAPDFRIFRGNTVNFVVQGRQQTARVIQAHEDQIEIAALGTFRRDEIERITLVRFGELGDLGNFAHHRVRIVTMQGFVKDGLAGNAGNTGIRIEGFWVDGDDIYDIVRL